ncbi:helicase-related protein [Candidatus Nitrosocosmicus hydrocola]|uniref:helicase-related protein n=1 Tax=Candidatus Nitrosocosmicus hydrocola TaxID=1826872 RepID=UPI001372A2B0|nr:helicase-related protein [Candidatus Nitrosocosmicus hydrocola]
MNAVDDSVSNLETNSFPSILFLKFPFTLKADQLAAVESWVENGYRGTILYSTGTGKTEIAFECAKRLLVESPNLTNNINASDEELTQNSQINTKSTISVEKIKKLNEHDPLQFNGVDQISYSFFNILILVPRISLIDQTINRLVSYGIPETKIGSYFGDRKQKREIMVSTYNSVVRNPILIKRSSMIILDEVHLIKDSSKSFIKLFDYVIEDPKKGILGLTATLDENDHNNSTIMAIIPPIIKYPIKNAVKDKRLAKPVVIPIKVSLTDQERKNYENFTTKIKNISNRFKRYDVDSMTSLLRKGGFASGMAKAWFSNVRKRKLLLSYAENKLSAASNIIENKFPDEKIMVFSETLESIQKLKQVLIERGIESKIIDAKVRASERQRILNQWGISFNVLLSVHTLEIGYDVPQVRIEIILATTSNINQIVQRIGRVLRKYEGKSIALIYIVYIPDTKDDRVIDVVAKAIYPKDELSTRKISSLKRYEHLKIKTIKRSSNDINFKSKESEHTRKNSKDKSFLSEEKKGKDMSDRKATKVIGDEGKDNQNAKRINKAYQIVEQTLKEKSLIIEEIELDSTTNGTDENVHDSIRYKKKDIRIFKVKSTSNKNKTYVVNLDKPSCTCADYLFRNLKCKHILATEFTNIEK